jgi:hypothetical protein
MVRLAPAGWKKERLQVDQDVQPYDGEAADSVSDGESALDLSQMPARVRPGFVESLICPPACSGESLCPRFLSVRCSCRLRSPIGGLQPEPPNPCGRRTRACAG